MRTYALNLNDHGTMAQKNYKTDEKEVDGCPSGRKPYQEPAFRHEKVFETMALHCGKIAGTDFLCDHRRNAS